MNERIGELRIMAYELVNVLGVDEREREVEFCKKFAELIVRDCVAQIEPMWKQVQEVGAPPGYDYDTFDLAYNDCMDAIKEHFGVKNEQSMV